MTAEARGSLS